MDTIGDILRQHIPNMGMYLVPFLSPRVDLRFLCDGQEYCVNEGTAIRLLQTLRMQNPELNAQLNVKSSPRRWTWSLTLPQRLREDPAVRNLDLSSYLLVPSKFSPRCHPRLAESPFKVQRITRYPLLIKQARILSHKLGYAIKSTIRFCVAPRLAKTKKNSNFRWVSPSHC